MYVVVWVPDSPTVCVCARVFESIVLTCEFVRLCMLCLVVCWCFLTCVCQSITICEPRGVFKCMCRIELEKLLARSDQGPPVIAIHHVDEYYPNPTAISLRFLTGALVCKLKNWGDGTVTWVPWGL